MRRIIRGGVLLLFPLILLACSDRPTGIASPDVSVQAAATERAGTLVFRADSVGLDLNAAGCWVDGNLNGCIQVSRSRASSPSAFLLYSVEECVPTGPPTPDTIPGDSIPPVLCAPVEGGFGTIPNGDLTGSGVRGLSLHTNTSAVVNPDFTRFAGSGGEVVVDWTPSGAFSSRVTGTGETSFGNFHIHFAGTTWFSDAVLSGNVIAFPLTTPTFGNFFKTQQLQVSMLRGP